MLLFLPFCLPKPLRVLLLRRPFRLPKPIRALLLLHRLFRLLR